MFVTVLKSTVKPTLWFRYSMRTCCLWSGGLNAPKLTLQPFHLQKSFSCLFRVKWLNLLKLFQQETVCNEAGFVFVSWCWSSVGRVLRLESLCLSLFVSFSFSWLLLLYVSRSMFFSLSLWSCDFAVEMSNSAGIWAAANTLHKALSLSQWLPDNKKWTSAFSCSSAEVNELTSWRQNGDLRQKNQIVSRSDCIIGSWLVFTESLQFCTQLWGSVCMWIMRNSVWTGL